MDAVRELGAQADRTTKLIEGVQADQLDLPTPCTEWDVKQLINHLCMTSVFCAQVAAGEEAEPAYETDFVGDDPAGAYRRCRDEMLEALAAPGLAERPVRMMGNEMPGVAVLLLALAESIVHRWDLAQALGVEHDIDPEAAAMVLELGRPMITDEMRASAADQTTGSVAFGPAVEVADDASPVDQLVAFLGRTP